eukprot:122189_1
MAGDGQASSVYHVVISCVSDAPTPYPSKAPSTSPPTLVGATPSPSTKPVIKPTPDSSNSPTQRPTKYVGCGDVITGFYNDESIILTVQMPYDGMLTFDATETQFERLRVEQINDLGQVLEHHRGKSMTLSNVKAANYKFKMFTEGYARGVFTVRIHCVETDVLHTTDDHHSTTGIDKHAYKSKSNQGSDSIAILISIMVALICYFCCCLVTWFIYLRKKRDDKSVPSNTHVHGASSDVPDAVQMMQMSLPPQPGEPTQQAPFRTYTDDINGESHTNRQNNIDGASEGVPGHIGNDAFYKHTLSVVDLPNVPNSSPYANIQVDDSSSSSDDINPVLTTPQDLISNQANGNANWRYGQNDNLNVNAFNAGSNANVYNGNKPLDHEGDYGSHDSDSFQSYTICAPKFRHKENHLNANYSQNSGQKPVTVSTVPYIRPNHVPNCNPNWAYENNHVCNPNNNAFNGYNQSQHVRPLYNQNNRHNNGFNAGRSNHAQMLNPINAPKPQYSPNVNYNQNRVNNSGLNYAVKPNVNNLVQMYNENQIIFQNKPIP